MEDYGIAVSVSRKFYSKDPACDLDDLCQIAAMGVIRAKEKYDPKIGAFSTYAYCSARNAILSHLKKTKDPVKKPVTEEYFNDILLDDYISDDWTDQERQILNLKLSGFTVKEIAAELQCSTATLAAKMRLIKNRIKRAIR